MKLELIDATIAYPIGISTSTQSILATAAKALSFGKLAKDGNSHTYVLGLNKISLNIKEGDRIGIIGNNGAGKSTLLKALAGILVPHSGRRIANCSIGCLLSLGAGMDFEKTGLENLRFIARLYGLSGSELKNTVDDAIDFSELGHFIDLPVRTYSSGMTARLAFSLATAKQSDIMLIDEVIGTGDIHFIYKAVDRIKSVCQKSGAVVMASHSFGVLNDFCDQGIWLDAGRIKAQGEIGEVWEQYSSKV